MLATYDDYVARYGDEDDEATVTTLLADADSLVKIITGQSLETASTTVILEAVGRRRLQLPELPVTAVASVVVDGTTWDTTSYQWTSDGSLWRLDRCAWPFVVPVTVTYTHGYAAGAAKLQPLIALCCRLANTYVSDLGNVRSHAESLGAYSDSSTLVTDAAGLRLRLDASDQIILDSFRAPFGP